MQFLTLNLKDDLREEITYNNHAIPFSICIDHFDDYLGREWCSHWHDEYEFILVLNGSIDVTIYPGKQKAFTVTLDEGNGMMISSGFLHSVKALESKTVCAGFVFSTAFFNIKPFENILQNLIKPLSDHKISSLLFSKQDEQVFCILQILEELCHLSKNEQYYDLHCMELVFRLWRFTLNYVHSNNNFPFNNEQIDLKETRLKSMLSYIHSHYNEKISVDHIAKHSGISRTECFRSFQDILKKTPTDYLIHYRLSMAGTMLLTTKKSVADIAYACGFNTPSYFGKLFKEKYGISPNRYRKAIEKSYS